MFNEPPLKRLTVWRQRMQELVSDDEYKGTETKEVGPLSELLSWKTKNIVISAVCHQILQKHFRDTASAIEASHPAEAQQWKELTLAMKHKNAETMDNVKYLYAMTKAMRPLYFEPPARLIHSIPRVVASVAWMSSISRFFNTPERLASLMQKVSVQIVQVCRRSIDNVLGPHATLWMPAYRARIVETLHHCIQLNDTYRAQYDIHKARLRDSNSIIQFDFSESYVFGPVVQFSSRAKSLWEAAKLLTIFDEALKDTSPIADYASKINIIETLHAAGDPFLLTETQFNRQNATFQAFADNFFQMLCKTVKVAVKTCRTTGAALDLLCKVQELAVMQHANVASTVAETYKTVLFRYREELQAVVKSYNENKHNPPLGRGTPPVAGHMRWARHLMLRISAPMQMLQDHFSLLGQEQERLCDKGGPRNRPPVQSHRKCHHRV